VGGIIPPADFVEYVERETGIDFSDDIAQAMFRALEQTKGGRTVCARVILPRFMTFLEISNLTDSESETSVPKMKSRDVVRIEVMVVRRHGGRDTHVFINEPIQRARLFLQSAGESAVPEMKPCDCREVPISRPDVGLQGV
jgi:hypothetical protein